MARRVTNPVSEPYSDEGNYGGRAHLWRRSPGADEGVQGTRIDPQPGTRLTKTTRAEDAPDDFGGCSLCGPWPTGAGPRERRHPMDEVGPILVVPADARRSVPRPMTWPNGT